MSGRPFRQAVHGAMLTLARTAHDFFQSGRHFLEVFEDLDGAALRSIQDAQLGRPT
jgi:hypothetical protein